MVYQRQALPSSMRNVVNSHPTSVRTLGSAAYLVLLFPRGVRQKTAQASFFNFSVSATSCASSDCTACIVEPALSFAQPCDEEHLIEERDSEEGVTFVSCARSRIRVGRVVTDSDSPSGKRWARSRRCFRRCRILRMNMSLVPLSRTLRERKRRPLREQIAVPDTGQRGLSFDGDPNTPLAAEVAQAVEAVTILSSMLWRVSTRFLVLLCSAGPCARLLRQGWCVVTCVSVEETSMPLLRAIIFPVCNQGCTLDVRVPPFSRRPRLSRFPKVPHFERGARVSPVGRAAAGALPT